MDWTSLASTAWIGALTFLAVFFVVSKARSRLPKGARLAPGPSGLPFVGFLPYLSKNLHHVQFREWAKVYGPVLRVKIAGTNLIILNDFETIKEYLNKKELLDRGRNLFADIARIKGVATMNGKEWVDNRRFCLHVLRDLGFGRKSMEEHIKEESLYLVHKIGETRQAPIAIQSYLMPSMSNNVTALVFGSRYPFEDPKRKLLDERLSRALKAIASGFVANFLPLFVVKVLLRMPFMALGAFRTAFKDINDFVRKEVSEHEATLDEYSNRDFIDGYLKKIKESKDDPDSSFKPANLVGNVLNFFGAGSNTVQLSIQWHLLNCAHKRDTVQRKIQVEIDEQVGKERQPHWEDHQKMPFTMATIYEMYRWRVIAPLSVPRGAAEDTFFGEYFIPKGTIVMPNLWAVHMDPKLWKNPEDFDPSRFLEEGGKLAAKPEHLIPFSLGKRMCPGETLATVEIFLYLTTLLQKYTVLPENEGATINLESGSTAINVPFPQKLRFIPR